MVELLSKTAHRKNLEPMGSLSEILGGFKNTSFWAFSRYLGPYKNPTKYPNWLQIFYLGSFWLQFKHILLWNNLKIIWAFKMSIFTYRFNLLSEIKRIRLIKLSDLVGSQF